MGRWATVLLLGAVLLATACGGAHEDEIVAVMESGAPRGEEKG